MQKKFTKVLVANRGEIAIRVFRACAELGIRTVAIYTHQDRFSLYRTKADESYEIGDGSDPLKPYLDFDAIIQLAKEKNVDAIHPGYGFLSENSDFARACEKNGIVFIGPHYDAMDKLGDKVKSKHVAIAAGVPVVPGTKDPITCLDEATEFASKYGYPIILKAAAGGGGRGMRIIREEKELEQQYHSAKNEALKAFGCDDVFIEKYVENPKHIEVQILGDKHGNIVHLFERDCSIQRRHQKIIEFAPSLCLNEEQKNSLFQDALTISKSVGYYNAGTVEFLVDQQGNHYFIEVNPRIQVEHTITEMITGIDLVQAQILVAAGYPLDNPEIGIASQDSITQRGYAIQCRITTEDPENNFAPDTGKINVYRTGSGFGIRLDVGNGFSGSQILPYYDSLLVKTCAWGLTFEKAAQKAVRSIRELRVRGVKTNQFFVENVLTHPTFVAGQCDTGFIEKTPELFSTTKRRDRANKILNYLGDVIVNGNLKNPALKDIDVKKYTPKVDGEVSLNGTKQLLDQYGPQYVANWVKEQKQVLYTDTTFRDAHQSLLATRVRTYDMLQIADATAKLGKDLFSLEMWGGATFDVAYNFLKEDPWERLDQLRQRIPNVLFQMLIRASNAVGYKNYPDNVVREFIKTSAERGIDVFRIFDSLNWADGMTVSLDAVLETGKLAEACICYTSDIENDKNDKYTLQYYVDLAKELERRGAHILGIKDMSGLLKPYAAKKLVTALKNEIALPIHFHTHDTCGAAVASAIMAAEAGVDIIDGATGSMSGLSAQPNLQTIIAALSESDRKSSIDVHQFNQLSHYWKEVRRIYAPFESDLKSSDVENYLYELPGGQYTNLKSQANSLGLGERFEEVKLKYAEANHILGNIVKVTPSSKVVGDLALFMVQNDLDENNIYEKGKDLSFPDSVIDFHMGMMGQPAHGFNTKLQEIVLKGKQPITCRPGELLEPIDFDEAKKSLKEKFGFEPRDIDVLSSILYPKVFDQYVQHVYQYGDISVLQTSAFFYGLEVGETIEVNIEEGKTLIIKLIHIGELKGDGKRDVTFELNGITRFIEISDLNASKEIKTHPKADLTNPLHIGASIPGKVVAVLTKEGEEVEKNQPLMVIEAMKMETVVHAKASGKIKSVLVVVGDEVQSADLLVELEN